jgi:hypothetical protein
MGQMNAGPLIIHTHLYILIPEQFNLSAARFLPFPLFQEPLHIRMITLAYIFYSRLNRETYDSSKNERD